MAKGRDVWDAVITMTPAAARLHQAAAITSPYDQSLLAVSIFVSCFNEQSTIAETLDTVAESLRVVDVSYEIIVIDDCSKDRSLERIRNYIENHPQLNIVLCANKENKGLARNYLDAAFIGSGKYYYMAYGDNSESMQTMVDIMRTLGEADIIVPYSISPYDRSAAQRFLSRISTLGLNLLSGNWINSYGGRHVHLRYNIMRWHPVTAGFAFQAELLCRMLDLGFTCKQLPSRVAPSRHAVSWRDGLSLLHMITDILLSKISRWLHKR